jgi:hypothetical protein
MFQISGSMAEGHHGPRQNAVGVGADADALHQSELGLASGRPRATAAAPGAHRDRLAQAEPAAHWRRVELIQTDHPRSCYRISSITPTRRSPVSSTIPRSMPRLV